jgi:hypothetical protein
MVIPCEPAKPLNSFLKSALTLKLSDFSFSLSCAVSALCVLAKRHLPAARLPLSSRLKVSRNTEFRLSCNPESQKASHFSHLLAPCFEENKHGT